MRLRRVVGFVLLGLAMLLLADGIAGLTYRDLQGGAHEVGTFFVIVAVVLGAFGVALLRFRRDL